MGVYLLLAARNLVQARRRTALLSVALVLVSMLLVLLLTLSQGLSDTMVRSATLLITGHVNVAGFYKTKPTAMGFPLITRTKEIRQIVEANTPGLDYIIDRSRGWCKIISENHSMQVVLAGIDAPEETRLMEELHPADTSAFAADGGTKTAGDPHALAHPGTLILFAGQAKRLAVGVGDVVTLTAETMSGRSNTTDAKVVAIVKDVGFMSNWNAFVPKTTVRELYQLNDDTSGAVMVYLKDSAASQAVMDHLRDVLGAKGFEMLEYQAQPYWMKHELVGGEDWAGQKLDLTTWDDEIGMLKWSLSALNSISFFLIGVLLIMIVVGIMNSMWIAVRERTQEIGTLRAIGMGKSRVLAMFMVEAFILGLVATSVGSALGGLMALLLDASSIKITVSAVQMILMTDTLHLTVRPSQIAGAVATFTTVTALATLWPAMRAARLQPVTAIHRIG